MKDFEDLSFFSYDYFSLYFSSSFFECSVRFRFQSLTLKNVRTETVCVCAYVCVRACVRVCVCVSLSQAIPRKVLKSSSSNLAR